MSLRGAEQPRAAVVAGRESVEQRVEGADRARQQAALPVDQLPFHPLHIGSLRHEQPRVAVERRDETVEQRSDLAGVCRADDERQAHRAMVVRASGTVRHRRPPGGGRRLRRLTSCERLRLAAAPGNRRPGHPTRARIAKICRFCTAPRVVERDAHDGTLTLFHFGSTLVANEHCLSRHHSS